MLVIKKQFIRPMTLTYIGIGISAFALTLGALYITRPNTGTSNSAVVTTSEQRSKLASSEDKVASKQDRNSENKDTSSAQPTNPTTQSTNASQASVAAPATAPAAQPASTASTPTPVEPQTTVSPAETDTSAAPIITETQQPTPEEAEEQDPSLLGNVLGGVIGVVDAIL